MSSFCTCGAQIDAGMSSCMYCDWVGLGMGESPHISEALTSLDGGEGSIIKFNNEIEDIFMHNAYNDALPFSSMYAEAAWNSTSCEPLPFLCPSPPSDYTGSSGGSSLDSPSPTPITDSLSDTTLVNEDEPGYDCSDVAGLAGIAFTFQYPSPSVLSYSSLSTPPVAPSAMDLSDFGYGQQVSQHDGAEATDVYGLGCQGVQGVMDDFMLPSTTPAPPSTGEGCLATVDDKVVVKKHQDNDEDIRLCEDEDEDRKPSRPTKRRKKQDTTPKFLCPKCTSKFARTHNLKVHIRAVHEGKREHECTHPGCERSFSRKHDLTRHFQSKHTSLGSPRNKGAKAGKKESD
ncbi:hypothetical protein L226DRAFT_564232 [Lentinus tigrinus ALCF2SS1-7]|uniref:uncharacterized protein n=1 Tax=Lentinus tigrinus ALCF2SS1-7 TaxID=1328758 RepID=UPI001165EC4D|nr:hypothetical protein L226DRAFT_564232 [Lentinus tigrinus ALCF2SS1-7]